MNALVLWIYVAVLITMMPLLPLFIIIAILILIPSQYYRRPLLC